MNWETPVLTILVATFLYNFFVCGFWGQYVAGVRNRSEMEGFFLGLTLGPIGVVVVACLPTIAVPNAAPTNPPAPEANAWDFFGGDQPRPKKAAPATRAMRA
jgi:hypothetical protein